MASPVSLMQQPQSREAVGWQQYRPADNSLEGQQHTAESSNRPAPGRQLMLFRGRGRFTQLEIQSSSESREELDWEHTTETTRQLAGLPQEAPQPAVTGDTSQQASGSEDERSSCCWWPDQALQYKTGGWSLISEGAFSPAHRGPSSPLELCSTSLDEYQYDHSQELQQPSDKQLADTGGWPEVEAARQAVQPQKSAQPGDPRAEAHHDPWGPPPICQVQADSWIADLHAQPQPSHSRDWMNACQPRRNGKLRSCLKTVCLSCPMAGRQSERGAWTAASPPELGQKCVKQKPLVQKAAGMRASAKRDWSVLSSATEQQFDEVSRLGMKLEEPAALTAAGAAPPGSWTDLLRAEHSPWIREEGESDMESSISGKKSFMEAWLDDLMVHMDSGLPPYPF